MQDLLKLSRAIDRVTGVVGHAVGWLVLASVLVAAGNAILGKLFNLTSNAWLELRWYLFGAVFMLGAAHTLERNEHIRIDILSSHLSKRTRDRIDLLGHLLALLPFTLILGVLTSVFFWRSVVSEEVSGSAGGLILWPARLVILAGFVLLLAQCLSEIIKRIGVMRGLIQDPHDAPPRADDAIAHETLHT